MAPYRHLPCQVNFSERLYEKEFDPFARIKSWPRMLLPSRLDRVDPAGRAKMFIRRKVSSARRGTLPSKEGDPARLVTLLAEPTLRLSCKWFVKFCKKMKEIWGQLFSIDTGPQRNLERINNLRRFHLTGKTGENFPPNGTAHR